MQELDVGVNAEQLQRLGLTGRSNDPEAKKRGP